MEVRVATITCRAHLFSGCDQDELDQAAYVLGAVLRAPDWVAIGNPLSRRVSVLPTTQVFAPRTPC